VSTYREQFGGTYTSRPLPKFSAQFTAELHAVAMKEVERIKRLRVETLLNMTPATLRVQ
jgi:hypothetical protein